MSAEVRLTREGRCIMSENLATWLRQQRETRGWTKREMARQLIQPAGPPVAHVVPSRFQSARIATFSFSGCCR